MISGNCDGAHSSPTAGASPFVPLKILVIVLGNVSLTLSDFMDVVCFRSLFLAIFFVVLVAYILQNTTKAAIYRRHAVEMFE